MAYGTTEADDLAISDAAILTSLLEMLVCKNVLSQGDVRAILADAVQLLDSRKDRVPAKAAIDLISDDLVPRFAEEHPSD